MMNKRRSARIEMLPYGLSLTIGFDSSYNMALAIVFVLLSITICGVFVSLPVTESGLFQLIWFFLPFPAIANLLSKAMGREILEVGQKELLIMFSLFGLYWTKRYAFVKIHNLEATEAINEYKGDSESQISPSWITVEKDSCCGSIVFNYEGSWVRCANYVEKEIAESFVTQVNLRIEALSKGIAENSEATER